MLLVEASIDTFLVNDPEALHLVVEADARRGDVQVPDAKGTRRTVPAEGLEATPVSRRRKRS